MNLGKAISIAAKAFENKTDKGGSPYILHCLWVMNNVRHLGETAMICAVLHDLIEDCPDWSLIRLKDLGFSDEVRVIINILTHKKDDSYEDYIKNIASSRSPICVNIKLKDLEHNMKPNRMKGLTKKDHDRIEKYHRWYTYLSKV